MKHFGAPFTRLSATTVSAFLRGCATWLFTALLLSALTALAAPDPDLEQFTEELEQELSDEERAQVTFQLGYMLHVNGRYEEAIQYYRQSIESYPTAEGHTFLGWSLSYLGQLEEAIAECKQAIDVDPDFGNPYNDIGVYLIDLGRPGESIPWFKKAMKAERYCCYHFPHFNLGRVLLFLGDIEGARRSFERALGIEPSYVPALEALEILDAMGTRAI